MAATRSRNRRKRKDRVHGPSCSLLRKLENASFNRPGTDKSWVSLVAEETRAYFASVRRR